MSGLPMRNYTVEQLQTLALKIHKRRHLLPATAEMRLVMTMDTFRQVISIFPPATREVGAYDRALVRKELIKKHPDCGAAPPRSQHVEGGPTNSYSPEFKTKVLQYVEDNPYLSLADVCRKHGIAYRTLHRWITGRR